MKLQSLQMNEDGELPDDGLRVTVCGIIADVTQKTTKNGDRMAFITLEDDSAEIECVVFPKVFEKVSHMLRVDNCIALNGNLQIRDEDVKILASGIYELVENARYVPQKPQVAQTPIQAKPQQASPQRVKKLFLRVPKLDCEQTKKAQNLVEIFEGTTAVVLYECESGKYLPSGLGAEVTPFLVSELKKILGEENVVYG